MAVCNEYINTGFKHFRREERTSCGMIDILLRRSFKPIFEMSMLEEMFEYGVAIHVNDFRTHRP